MRGAIQVLIILILLFIGVPLAVGLMLGEEGGNYTIDYSVQKIKNPSSIKVWNEEKGKTEKIDFEEYVCNVVASEMPSSFEVEALKAQAVAARTYAMAKIIKFQEAEEKEHPKAPLCNTTHCQVYRTKKQLIETHGEEWEKEGYKRVKDACRDTEGEMLYYEGQLVTQPLFFSSSGGQTENSEDVFSGEFPYLVSVSSLYEEGASHSNEEKVFSFDEIEQKLNATFTERTTGELKENNIKILSRTAGGRVDLMQVGQSTYKGTEIRTALGLSSALFTVAFEKQNVMITTNGYGHGVGMSQYGANGMAKEGKDYVEILGHYYTGTKVY